MCWGRRTRADRDLPKNLSSVLTDWRKGVQDTLDAEDAHTIALCNKHGVIEEDEPGRRRRPRARPCACRRAAA
jgi:hypothetical protein